MRTKIIITLVSVVALVLGSAFLFTKAGPASLRGEDTSSWYAMHLNNGVVYYGHVVEFATDAVAMSGAYYFEKYELPTTSVSKSKSFEVAQTPKQVYRLVALGDENTHTVSKKLYLNRTAVLFWEKLSDDSDVVNSIKAASGQQKTESSK